MDSGAAQTRELPVQEITIDTDTRDILAREFRSRTGAAPGLSNHMPGLRYQDIGGNAAKLFNLPLKDTRAAAVE